MKLTYPALAAVLLTLPLALSAHAEGATRPAKAEMTLEQIKAKSAERHGKMESKKAEHRAKMDAVSKRCHEAVQNAPTKEAALAAKEKCRAEHKAMKAEWKKKHAEMKEKRGDRKDAMKAKRAEHKAARGTAAE